MNPKFKLGRDSLISEAHTNIYMYDVYRVFRHVILLLPPFSSLCSEYRHNRPSREEQTHTTHIDNTA